MSIREQIAETLTLVPDEELPVLLAVIAKFVPRETGLAHGDAQAALDEARAILSDPGKTPGYPNARAMIEDLLHDETDA